MQMFHLAIMKSIFVKKDFNEDACWTYILIFSVFINPCTNLLPMFYLKVMLILVECEFVVLEDVILHIIIYAVKICVSY